MRNNKRLWIILSILVLLACIIVVAYVLLRPHYRSIKLDEYEGSVSLTRQEKTVEPYKGIMLIPGDLIETMQGAFATLFVDNDKHLGVKENTRLSINATGTDTNGKVAIDLEYGEALIEIENKLNAESSFEVTTPNAVLAVRGTTFNVYYSKEENTSKIDVEEGTVAVNYGTDFAEQLLLNAGDSVIITDDAIVDDSLEEIIDEPVIEEEFYSFSVIRWLPNANETGYLDQRGRITIELPDEAATESTYADSIYDTYLEPHKDEVKQFAIEARETEAQDVFAGFPNGRFKKDITDWFPQDTIVSIDGNKTIRITEATMIVRYRAFSENDGSIPESELIINANPTENQYTYAVLADVMYNIRGVEE